MKFYLFFAFAVLVVTVTSAQKQSSEYTTPVPILKQINKHNEDGSYSYGYEAADGTFKIETKYPNGEVFGKYGYIDDSGKLREVEYGASRRGFEPTGNEIQVPPPTLNVDKNYAAARPLGPNQEDDGQYREDPSVYYKNQYPAQPASRYPTQSTQHRFRQPATTTYQSRYQPNNYQDPYYQQPAYQPQEPAYQPQSAYQPSYRPQPTYNNFAPRYNNPVPPAYPNYNQFAGHPASNVDIVSGSYSVNYRR